MLWFMIREGGHLKISLNILLPDNVVKAIPFVTFTIGYY